MVISRSEFKRDPGLTRKLFDTDVFKRADKALMKKVFNLVKSGRTEIYVNKDTSSNSLADNITVFVTLGRISMDAGKLKQLRKQLIDMIQTKLGRKAELFICEPRTIGGKNVVFLEMAGMVQGTRYISCQLQKSSDAYLTMSMTTRLDTLDRNRKDFLRVIESLKFTPSE
jgi:hypothetical protein